MNNLLKLLGAAGILFLAFSSCALLGKPVNASTSASTNSTQESSSASNIQTMPDGTKIVTLDSGAKIITDPKGNISYSAPPPPVNQSNTPTSPTVWDMIVGIIAPIAGTFNPLIGAAVLAGGKLVGDNFINKSSTATNTSNIPKTA